MADDLPGSRCADRAARRDQGLRDGTCGGARRGRGRSAHCGRGVRGDHGTVGVGQVDGHEHHRLPRHADHRRLPVRRDRCRSPQSQRSARCCVGTSLGSSSRVSICWLGPRRSRTSSCRLSIVVTAPAASRALAMNALTRVGLKGREHHTSSELSGGQQQRVAIARAIVTEPAVLLADEPTGNLDSRDQPRDHGHSHHPQREHGITIIMVTHEADIAAYARARRAFRGWAHRGGMSRVHAGRKAA